MINWLSNVKPLHAIFLTIGFLILSFVLVHIFAIFGIFVAIGFPIWWILFPRYTTCLYCRGTSVGKKCKACGEVVEKQVSPPKNFKSVAINTLTILFVSILSTCVVYVEYKVLDKYVFPDGSKNIVEFVIPESKQYKIGEIFPVRLEIDTHGAYVNAVQCDLDFDPEIAEVVKVSLEGSFATVFIQNETNNEKGYLRITGGLPNPGYMGEKGLFATVYLRSKKAGILDMAFLPTSLVLENDGEGTNILKLYPTISYLVKPEYISDSEKEIQESIYNVSVLGVMSDDEQMLLFDEEKKNVLGTEDAEIRTEDIEEKINIGKKLFEFDSKIIEIVKVIFSLFEKIK